MTAIWPTGATGAALRGVYSTYDEIVVLWRTFRAILVLPFTVTVVIPAVDL
jgi:hypothetical protein